MTFEDIFKDRSLILPKSIPKNKTYRQFLFELFEKYLELLDSINPKKLKIAGMKTQTNFNFITNKQKEFINGIKKSIDFYYDGKPFQAYEEFSKIMEFRTKHFKTMLNLGVFKKETNFYRLRAKADNIIFSNAEMFHIPFENRGKVSTQRYSIPGYPSLYLGTSLYISWEELNRPKLDTFQAVRLESNRNIKYLDLTFPDFYEDEIDDEAYKYLMTWPLIAACSLKVKDYTDNFKPEYLVSQFLLQWTRINKDVDGIKYPSTHIESKSLKSHEGLCNLVLPVKENKDKGYCSELISLFKITETLSWQLLELAQGGQELRYSIEAQKQLDRKLPKLEIIKGIQSNYSATSFGKLERQLNIMLAKPIE